MTKPQEDHYIEAPSTPRQSQLPLRLREPSPLQNASLASVMSTQWLQPLISLGANKPLERDDVWAMCPEDTCDPLHERFAAQYDPFQPPQLKSWLNISPFAIALVKTFRRELLVIHTNYYLYVLAMTMQTFIANAILDYLNGQENMFHIGNAYLLVVMMAVVSFLGVTWLAYGFFVSSRVGANIRSLMMDVVFQKALRLSCAARQSYTTGEIVTLMSVDSERIFQGMVNGLWISVAPLAFVITIVLIAVKFDVLAAVCGAVVLVLIFLYSAYLADGIGDAQKKLFHVAEERVRLTSEALQGIRVMKFYAWEDSLARRIEHVRKIEIQLYRRFHYLQIINTTLLFLAPVFLGGVVLGVYVLHVGDLSVTRIYTLMTIVNISRYPVSLFPAAIAAMSQAAIACDRMDTYMTSDEFGPELLENGHDLSEPTQPIASNQGSISVRDGNFQWSDASSPADIVVIQTDDADADSSKLEASEAVVAASGFAMDGVNIEIDSGSLVMIVGKVGAGKSSLLHALLGEMAKLSGAMEVNGELAYVSQEAWIRNATVKDNILFGEEFDAERYNQVLEATQLAMDLHSLPNGDQTEIGDRGINLSGGQKARVSIARAMYCSNYDILILDDPLSAVDPHVAHAIFDQCIVGLARPKTRLLVLNSHYDLLKHADKILVVNSGRIVADGTYQDIIQQFAELHIESEHTTKQDEHSELEPEEKPAEAITDDASKTTTTEAGLDVTPAKGPAGLSQAEDRVKGRVTGRTYKEYFDETGVNGLVTVAVLMTSYLISQAVRVFVDWWQGHWAKNMHRDGVDPTYSGTWFGMWYLGIIAICSVVTLARGFLLMESCVRSSSNLHNELFRRVLRAPVNRYFDVTPVGQILNRFSNDLDQVDSVLPQQYQYWIQNFVGVVGCLVVCAMASYWIAVAYIPILAIFAVTGLYFKKTSRELKRLEGISRTPIYNLFSETLNGLQTIRAFKVQRTFMKRNKDAIDENASFYFIYWAAGRWLAVRLDYVSVLIITVVSLYLVATKGQVSSVMAGISITYSLMLTSMVQGVVRGWDRTDNVMTGVERLLHFRTIPQEVDTPNSQSMDLAIWPPHGSIRFQNLCLKYRPELPLVLRGVNMDIGAGEKVGICGRTGAGKSSLMIALFRICDFESGTIFIDGTDIQNVKLRDLRRSLAIIPQDPVLFSGSLRENLDPHGDYSDNAVWSVLKQVHLSDSVEKWGNGLDYIVAEQGDNLSVGQRQLLCIGRALLKDSKIVVLDEATANVDTATDNLIQVTIRETFQAKTVLIIAHRINTIMHCDKIAVMDAGQVAEFGSPTELLGRSDSIFTSLATKTSH